MSFWTEHKTLILQTALSLGITLFVSFASFYMNVAKMDDRMTNIEAQSRENNQRLDNAPNKAEVVYIKEFEPFKTDLINQFQGLDNRLVRMEQKQDRVLEILLGRSRVSYSKPKDNGSFTVAEYNRKHNISSDGNKNTYTPVKRNSKFKFWLPVYDYTKKIFGND